jgi:hypothetical protein
VLEQFSIDGEASLLAGGLLHLSVSGVYGALFGLAVHALTRLQRGEPSIWLIAGLGSAYGLLLALLAQWVILPATDSPLREVAPLHFVIAHGLYGLILGYLNARR